MTFVTRCLDHEVVTCGYWGNFLPRVKDAVFTEKHNRGQFVKSRNFAPSHSLRYLFRRTIANTMNTRLQAVLNILCWVLIALLAVATLRWTVWASHQPRPHSVWGEPSEKPLD